MDVSALLAPLGVLRESISGFTALSVAPDSRSLILANGVVADELSLGTRWNALPKPIPVISMACHPSGFWWVAPISLKRDWEGEGRGRGENERVYKRQHFISICTTAVL